MTIVLMDNGFKAELIAKHTADNTPTMYTVRTPTGVFFEIDAKRCHIVLDPEFQPFQIPSGAGF